MSTHEPGDVARPADAAVPGMPNDPPADAAAPGVSNDAPAAGASLIAPADPAPLIEPAAGSPAPAPPAAPAAAPADAASPASPAPRERRPGFLEERQPLIDRIPADRLAARTRRDFLVWGLGAAASAVLGWWLLPDRARPRLLGALPNDRLDTLASRVGLSRANRERTLDRALTFDDDVAEALYSKDRTVRTYDRSQAQPLRNNYDGRTPGPEYLPGWRLSLSGLESGRIESLAIEDLLRRFPPREQVTRLCCVEGWSAVAWWSGFRFRELLDAFPPAPGVRWAALRSAVNLDGSGRPDPYYVSIDLETARHPQALLATHHMGEPLPLAHGAPLRLVVPMKLGLKNIKAITEIAYTVNEPADYWNERGYSRYDGL